MPTVLIVEDDRDTRQLEQVILESSGFNVRTACNGRDGLRELREGRPCVVVLDLMMPVMDGLGFLEERRCDPALRRIPVLCVTAADPSMMADAMRLGAQECLQKPTDFEALSDLVARYCVGS